MSKDRNRGLGRGLSSLMADMAPATGEGETPRRPDLTVPIEKLHPNRDQPRRTFDEEKLEELSASIREKGIIQPLIVRPDPGNPGEYQIVAGERRWRASQRARLHMIPVILRDYSDVEVLEVAIIENIQRSDLNPLDEAAAYRQLMDSFGHTQEQLGTALGKSRSHVANSMRLLSLPEAVQAHLVDGKLTAGHARALIGHPRAQELAERIIRDGLNVREAERLSKQPETVAQKQPRAKPGTGDKDQDTIELERHLSAGLGLSVAIDHKPGGQGGRLILSYRDLGQLDDLIGRLSGG